MSKLDIVTCLALSFLFINLCSFRHSDHFLNDEHCWEDTAQYTLCYADTDREEVFMYFENEEPEASMMSSTDIVMYIPIAENELRTVFRTFTNAVYESTGQYIKTIISISPTENNTIIYYDHWEDGYEVDPKNPTQATTEIWGDQSSVTGMPPGSTTDLLNSGNIIALENNIRLPRNPDQIRYDSRDKITSTKFIALTKSVYPLTPGPVLAGSVEVIDTSTYGTFYEIPVGESSFFDGMFEHVSVFIMASENETAIQIDKNGDGIPDVTTTINEGENYFVEGRTAWYYPPSLRTGATITSSKPIQVHMIAGDLGGYYETRFFTLYPKDLWDNCYYNPVGTTVADDPTHVMLYNPNPHSITMLANTLTGSNSFSIPPKNVYQYEMPFNSGAHFYTANPAHTFFAIAVIDANVGENSSHDWGFTLLPEQYLSCSGVIGWGPGNEDLSGNGNPIWVTAIENTIVYADFDNNSYTGALVDPEGNRYDEAYEIEPYESIKIFDAGDNDQTGARVYTLNGARIAIAWGQDPLAAEPGNPYLDLGTTVTPEQKIVAVKRAEISNDANGNGMVDPGDEITFHLHLSNQSLQTEPEVYITDTIPTGLTYQPNSTSHNGTSIPDNTSPVIFPLYGTGYYLGDIIPYQFDTISFITIANPDIFGLSELRNRFYAVSDGTDTLTASVELPINQIEATSCILDFTDAGGVSQSGYEENAPVCVSITDNDSNSSITSVDSVSITIYNLVNNDWETITLLETEVNSGIFRTCIPGSASGGQMPEDGTLYAVSGDLLSATYVDQIFEDACSETSGIVLISAVKQLYLTDELGLDRIDPVASGDGTTSIAVMPSGAGGSLTFTQTPGMCQDFRLTANSIISANSFIHVTGGTMPANPDIQAIITYGNNTIQTLVNPLLTYTPGNAIRTVRDEFDAVDYGLNHGYTTWSTNWLEVDEATVSPSTGQITITGDQLHFVGDNTQNPYIFRQVDLSGTLGATLSYDISGSGTLDAGPDRFEVQISSNGGFSWASLQDYNGNVNAAESFDISAYISSNTSIRFNIRSGVLGTDEFYTIDNVNIEYTLNSSVPTLLTWDAILPFNVNIPPGDSISVEFVNNESGVDFNILYDSDTRNSFLNLPTSTIITVNDLSIYDAPYPDGAFVLSARPNDDICIRTTVGDPFGTYDISETDLQLVSPSNDTINIPLTEPDTIYTNGCEKAYEYCFNVGNEIGSYDIQVVAHEGLENTITDTVSTTINITLTDLGSPCSLSFTDTDGNPQQNYEADDTICIKLSDTDKNSDPLAIDAVTIVIKSIGEDTETLTALETGNSTGIFQVCIPTNSTITGTDEDGTLYAPRGILIEAIYIDSEYSNDICIENALINSEVPDISLAKRLTTHSDSMAILSDVLQFDIVVANPGTTIVPVVALYDNFEETCVQFDSASIAPDFINGGALTWHNVGPLFPGEHIVVSTYFTAIDVCAATINEVTTEGIDVTNTILTDGPDSASVTITNPRLIVNKTLNCYTGDPFQTTDVLDYEIYIENTGTTTITTLPLSDFSSDYCLELIQASPIQPDAVGGGTVLWSNLGPLAPGESINITASFRAIHACDPANNVADISYAIDENGDYVPPVKSEVSILVEDHDDNLSISTPTICIGEDATLTLSHSETDVTYQLQTVSNDSLVGTAVGGTGGVLNYTISGISETTSYYVVATDDISGCRETLTDSAFVIVYPTVWVNPDSITICIQNQISVQGNPSGGSGIFTAHAWIDLQTGSSTGYSLSDTTTASLTADLSSATTGTINLEYSVTDNNGCTASDTSVITLSGIDGYLTTNVLCDDNNTSDDSGDDTFTFTIQISGDGDSDWRGLGQTGQLNQEVTMGPFPIYEGDITGIITSDICNQQFPVNITAPDACSTDAPCNIVGLITESFCCRACSAGNIFTYISNMENFEIPTEQNIALNKPTRMSSRALLQRSNSGFAVDNITNGDSTSNPDLTITAMEETPWWEIDLTGNFNLTSLNVYGRTDCCSSTNYDYTILVSNNPFTDFNLANASSSPGVSVFTHSQTGGNMFPLPVNTSGRFIRIYLQETNQLQLAEVQIIGTSHSNTNPYNYTWSDPAIGNTAEPDCLAPGDYSVTIEDTVTGCQIVKSIVISE